MQEWKDLAPVDDGSNQYLGDLCISLRYVPSSGKLTGTLELSFRELLCSFLKINGLQENYVIFKKWCKVKICTFSKANLFFSTTLGELCTD